MNSEQVENIVRNAYEEVFQSKLQSMESELLEALKDASNENGGIGSIDLIQHLLPFFLTKSLEISSKATSHALKEIFASQD